MAKKDNSYSGSNASIQYSIIPVVADATFLLRCKDDCI